MIDDQEMVFVVDENNTPIKPQPRSIAHKNLLWHRTTDVFIINRNGQILTQQRSLKKDIKPGYWSVFFGGHLAPGEEYLQNAVEEVNEEIGIQITEQDLIPYKVFKSDKPTHKEFPMNYGLVLDTQENKFKFEKEEIDQVVWKNMDEVKKILVVEKNPQWVLKPWDEEILNWLLTLI